RQTQAGAGPEVTPCGLDDSAAPGERKPPLTANPADPATGRIRLKAQFDNADEPLWPGEFVNARLVLSIRENAVTVSADAVMQGPNGPYVYVLGADDTAQRRAVEVAATQDGISVIARGVQSGERVVVEGQYRLTEGAKVKVGAPQQAEASQQAVQ